MTAGYSGRPLAVKLGIGAGDVLAIVDDPGHFEALVAPLPRGVQVRRSGRGRADVVVCFVMRLSHLRRRLPTLGRMIHPAGSAWVAWPKRASGVASDVTEDRVREAALPLGLVDTKVAAIDDIWSALRLVWRVERR